jgi:hypothetical protein
MLWKMVETIIMKMVWFGHKLQTYGLEWIGLFVVLNGSKILQLIFQSWNNIFYLKILNIDYG